MTLLNCDCKIFAKAIANWIIKVLLNTINNDLTGLLKGRFVGENICTIEKIIIYSNYENKPRLLLLVDFKKAFDTLE